MPISFAFCKPLSGLYNNPMHQAEVLAVLEMVSGINPGNDASRGALAEAVSTGIERNPVPSITQRGIAFVVDDSWDDHVPGAQNGPSGYQFGRVVEVLLNEQFYVVLSLHSGRTRGYEWVPFAVENASTSRFGRGRVTANSSGMAPPRSLDPVASVVAVSSVRQGPRLDLYDLNRGFGNIEDFYQDVEDFYQDDDDGNPASASSATLRIRRSTVRIPRGGRPGTVRIPRG